jgi:two-component system cell cycle sensor histidine kinase/response regulator CckA
MLLRRLIGEEVKLVTILARELGLVRADPGQLEQVLISLAVNARDGMPDGGSLTLTTSNVVLDESFARAHAVAGVGAHVLLSLNHSGLAASAEAKARSFESFTTKRPGTGTWLGLSTVERIARQSGGCMLIESKPGYGTTFRIYLPRARAITTLHGHETILVVDDDMLLKDLAVRVLQGYGYTVLSASDAGVAAALAASHTGPIQLLVIDAALRGASSTALPAQLTAARPELRVLYVSGHSHDALVSQRDLAPADSLLHKPFTPVSLARAVREALDGVTFNPTREGP